VNEEALAHLGLLRRKQTSITVIRQTIPISLQSERDEQLPLFFFFHVGEWICQDDKF
jgi:hypothetical protein